jgi:hypothetical protein
MSFLPSAGCDGIVAAGRPARCPPVAGPTATTTRAEVLVATALLESRIGAADVAAGRPLWYRGRPTGRRRFATRQNSIDWRPMRPLAQVLCRRRHCRLQAPSAWRTPNASPMGGRRFTTGTVVRDVVRCRNAAATDCSRTSATRPTTGWIHSDRAILTWSPTRRRSPRSSRTSAASAGMPCAHEGRSPRAQRVEVPPAG